MWKFYLPVSYVYDNYVFVLYALNKQLELKMKVKQRSVVALTLTWQKLLWAFSLIKHEKLDVKLILLYKRFFFFM